MVASTGTLQSCRDVLGMFLQQKAVEVRQHVSFSNVAWKQGIFYSLGAVFGVCLQVGRNCHTVGGGGPKAHHMPSKAGPHKTALTTVRCDGTAPHACVVV
jgi:hypothetical protein